MGKVLARRRASTNPRSGARRGLGVGSGAVAFETVTGYCWPQTVAGGGTVGLHLSSARGRPVAVEVARVGWRREVVFSDPAVPVDHHPTPHGADRDGCGWPAAVVLDVDPAWRSGYYEVVLEIDVDGR
ncbi:MAG TPA: hypothetical protein VNQ53_11125, partial [Nocardioides sp.]|nr:hypothetical protein [Nocardioides sp.]